MAPFPQHLLDGYRTFTSQRLPTEQTRYRELSERGQSPEVMVIGCCDSRVSPEVIFDASPGELFVVPRGVQHRPPARFPELFAPIAAEVDGKLADVHAELLGTAEADPGRREGRVQRLA